jgi:hypothetical protein
MTEEPTQDRWWAWLLSFGLPIVALIAITVYAVVTTHGIHPVQAEWRNP